MTVLQCWWNEMRDCGLGLDILEDQAMGNGEVGVTVHKLCSPCGGVSRQLSAQGGGGVAGMRDLRKWCRVWGGRSWRGSQCEGKEQVGVVL